MTRKRSATTPFRHALCCCRTRWRANRGAVRASVASALEMGAVVQTPPRASIAAWKGEEGGGECRGNGDGGGDGGVTAEGGDGGDSGSAAVQGLVEVLVEARSLFTPPGQPAESLGIMLSLPTSAEQPVPSLFLPVQVRSNSIRSVYKRIRMGCGNLPVVTPRSQVEHVTRRPRSGVKPYVCVALSNDFLCGIDREFVEANVHVDPVAAWDALQEFERKHAASRFTYTCRDSVTA